MTNDALISLFAEAIAHFEGFYPSEYLLAQPGRWPSVAKRNNNPGNMRSWAKDSLVVGGYVKFPSDSEGFRALRRQCEKNIFERNLTCLEFFGGERKPDGTLIPQGYPGYAPAADFNHPKQYANFVRQFLMDRGVRAFSLSDELWELAE